MWMFLLMRRWDGSNFMNCAIVNVRKGEIDAHELEKNLNAIFYKHNKWPWQIREMAPNFFSSILTIEECTWFSGYPYFWPWEWRWIMRKLLIGLETMILCLNYQLSRFKLSGFRLNEFPQNGDLGKPLHKLWLLVVFSWMWVWAPSLRASTGKLHYATAK